MLAVYLILALEAVLLLAIPPHFGVMFVRQYWLYYPNGGNWFAITYAALFVFQVLSAVSLQFRLHALALLLGGTALLLASLTFNSTAYQITFGDWIVITAFGLFSAHTTFASVCELLPFVAGSALVTLSVRGLTWSQPPP